MEAIHTGKEIKKALRQKDISVNQLSEMLGRHNTVVYRWLRKKHLDCGLLAEISKALEHDFFSHYCQCEKVSEAHEKTQALEKEVQELKKENAYLKEINTLLRK